MADTLAVLGNRIEKIVDSSLRPLGFAKKGKNWKHASSETIRWVNLQKAGNQYYLNLAVSVIELHPAGHAEEPVWHIIGCVFSPNVKEKVEWEKCLKVTNLIVSFKPREQRLQEILEEKIVPLLRAFESLESLKKVLLSGQLRGMGVRSELQDFTGYRA